jgi:hypothetical protein
VRSGRRDVKFFARCLPTSPPGYVSATGSFTLNASLNGKSLKNYPELTGFVPQGEGGGALFLYFFIYFNLRILLLSTFFISLNIPPPPPSLSDDVMLTEMSVLENLMFSARAKLPSTVTAEQRVRLVDAVLEMLGLTHVRHSRITLISGGQRKSGWTGGGGRD